MIDYLLFLGMCVFYCNNMRLYNYLSSFSVLNQDAMSMQPTTEVRHNDEVIFRNNRREFNCDGIYLGWTPIHWSSVHGMKWLTEHLIKRGANLRIQTHLGVSAMDCTNAFDRSQASIAVLKKGEVKLIHHLRFM